MQIMQSCTSTLTCNHAKLHKPAHMQSCKACQLDSQSGVKLRTCVLGLLAASQLADHGLCTSHVCVSALSYTSIMRRLTSCPGMHCRYAPQPKSHTLDLGSHRSWCSRAAPYCLQALAKCKFGSGGKIPGMRQATWTSQPCRP